MADRPTGRKRHVSGTGSHVKRRGEGTGIGPAGSGRGSSGGMRPGVKRGGGISLLAVLAFLIFTMFNPGSSSSTGYTGNTDSSWSSSSNSGVLNTDVADGSRDKFTVLMKNGNDQSTVMVYMCGADLESSHGMATKDLAEMCSAELSDNVNVLVYTGGAKQWHNSAVSASSNAVYQIVNGSLKKLKDCGDEEMTDPDVLTSFIRYGTENYPANRYDLILWDHGGGSISGYGYDEKHASAGSMTLSEIHQAVGNSGVKFDFIGFDACLMAAAENALALSDDADYLIASEETEPGTGWYYTRWLSDLAKDPGMDTVNVGKEIVDDFIEASSSASGWSDTTLSLTDLAEFSHTFPEAFADFAEDTEKRIRENAYESVSSARAESHAFASGNRLDMIDLADFAEHMDSDAGEKLSETVKSAVKYNRVSDRMTNAYGLSIYFPYENLSNVDNAAEAYEDIGMDETYTDCIRSFAKMEAGGQSVNSGSDLFTILSGGSNSSGSMDVDSILNQLLENSPYRFMSEASLSDDAMKSYVKDNTLDASGLIFEDSDEGPVLSLSEEEWAKVDNIEENMFIDDGTGYIDMGLDNTFSFNDDNDLIADTEGTWLAVNNQPVPYYYVHTAETDDDTVITGRVPAVLNGEYVNLILTFDSDHPSGYVSGYVYDYRNEETDTVPKAVETLEDGDVIDFVADYYSYDGTYQDSYMVGEEIVVDGDLSVSDVTVPEKMSVCYRFTDICGGHAWTNAIVLDHTES